jgi:hypothetical protein
VALVSGLALLAADSNRGYFFGLVLGLFLSSTVGGLTQLRAVRFHTRHLDERIEFWKHHYGGVRPRAYYSAVGLLVVGAAAIGLGVATGTAWLIGLPQFPCLGAATVIIALHGRLRP